MRSRIALPLVCLVLAPAAIAAAQGAAAPSLSLRDALGEALGANPELVALQRQYEASRAAIPGARSLDAPMFSAQVWGWPVTTLNPARTDMYMFMAEQPLPGRGKRASRELVATRDADVSHQQIAARANGILNAVRQAYTDLIFARATMAIYDRQTPVLEDTVDAATLRYAAGYAGQHDTVASVVELARLKTDAIEWHERARVAETRLNVLMARAPDAAVPRLTLESATAPSVVDATRLALERHPEVALAAAAIAREEAELARLRGERRPDFAIGGGYMLRPGGAGSWTARGAITWPNAPWARGGLNTAIEVQERRLVAARAAHDVVTSAIRRLVHESIIHLEAARERVSLLEAAVLPHVEHALEVARVTYASNRGEFADLLDTERVILVTRLDLARAQADVARAIADLETAIGEMPETPTQTGGRE